MLKLFIDTLSDVFSNSLNFLADGVESLTEKDHSINAEFGNPRKLISGRNKGFCVDGKRFLDIHTSRQNMCVVAGSGKGEDSGAHFSHHTQC